MCVIWSSFHSAKLQNSLFWLVFHCWDSCGEFGFCSYHHTAATNASQPVAHCSLAKGKGQVKIAYTWQIAWKSTGSEIWRNQLGWYCGIPWNELIYRLPASSVRNGLFTASPFLRPRCLRFCVICVCVSDYIKRETCRFNSFSVVLILCSVA